MNATEHNTAFLDRFETLRRRNRRVRLGTAIGLTAVVAAGVIGLSAYFDYRYELAWNIRAIALAVGTVAAVLFLLFRVWSVSSVWSRPTTAAELERQFPELGQRVRTTVQFDGDGVQDGVTPTLVDALQSETSDKTAPLKLQSIVPSGRMVLTAGVAVAAALALFAVAKADWEWRTAIKRSLLSREPFTRLEVATKDVTVKAEGGVDIEFQLQGRTEREVTLLTRLEGEDDWSERLLDPADAEHEADRVLRFTAPFAKINKPFEYRIVAGPAESETYRVDVQYPLSIARFQAEIESPTYTGLPRKVVTEGNLSALRGSQVSLAIELDRKPSFAEAVFRRVGRLEEGEEREHRRPLEIDDNTLRTSLEIDADWRFSVVARASDGTELPENAFRIRMREDRPPRVGFQSPDEQLEVHTLAEVLMRIRSSDDYGLSRVGIVFQINNNEEHTLLDSDFTAAADAAKEIEETGLATPRTRAVLERVLPLEYFTLTQKDCVIYYAFAEDNFPETPHRTESDLRFIDVRPFKMTFRMREPGEPGAGGGGGVTSLEEIIRRERYALNRTIHLERRPETFRDKELGTVERLIEYQAELADLSRALAEELQRRDVDDVDALFQAEAAMLNAVDSLSVGKYDTAILQEKDAQQYLVEARNRLEILLQQTNNSALQRALSQANRALRMKLRRKNSGQNGDNAQQLIDRLRQLAKTEARISGQLMGLANAAGMQSDEEMKKEGDGLPSMQQLEERQLDALAEAQDVRDLLEGMEVTELAKERMQAAVEKTDEASGTIARGDTDRAAAETADAAEQFDELAQQVAALLAKEAPQKVALSGELTAGLAERQRGLAEQLKKAAGSEQEKSEETEMDTAAEAKRLATRADTVEDVLQALAKSPRPDDGEAADRVAEIITEQKVSEVLDRVKKLPQAVKENPESPQTAADLADNADRTEVVARELNRLYRKLVTPRIEELRELEEQAAKLNREMPEQESEQDVQGWQRELEELLEDIEKSGVGGEASEELTELADEGRMPQPTEWAKKGDTGFLTVPTLYEKKVPKVVEELQDRIQELVLTDLASDKDAAVPPQYQHLVDQYLKVLAAERPGEETKP